SLVCIYIAPIQRIEEIIRIILCCCFQLLRSFFLTQIPVAEDDLRLQSKGPFGGC
ncbi:unnamed protein product, partial [Coccothraustes coccothraustes]